jgi:AmiR/NasT family two-component response regulator
MAFAGQAEVLLGEVLHRSSAARLTAEQIATLRADAAVDHAVGVIVAQRGCDPTEAYVVLHETAQRLDLRPRDVAARLVETAIRR